MNRRLAFSIRLVWVLALLASLGVLFAALPGYFSKAGLADPAAKLPTLALVESWLGIGLSLSAALVSLALACLVFWKKASDGMALFLSFYLLLYAIIDSGPIEVFAAYWLPQSPYFALLGVVSPMPGLVFLLIFPNGRFVPRWTRGLVPLAMVLALLALTFEPEEAVKLNTLRAQITIGALWLLAIFAVGIQIYRYRALYTPVERQQTKWVVYGLGLSTAFIGLAGIPYLYLLNQPAHAPAPWWSSLAGASWSLIQNIGSVPRLP
jgi:hypothetical protein